MIHYNEHKIKVIRNYLGLIIQKQIIKHPNLNRNMVKRAKTKYKMRYKRTHLLHQYLINQT